MWLLKKKPVKVAPKEPKRWPSCHDDLRNWMEDTITWYKYKKWNVWELFSPYYASYMPKSIHVGFSFDEVAKQAYRDIKERYPEYVQQARQNFPSSVYSYSRVGDNEDYDPDHDQKIYRDM